MRLSFLILLIASPVFALSPIVNDYTDKNDVYREFKNLFDNAQDSHFREIVTSTPNWQDLDEGQIVIYVSTPSTPLTDVHTMLRVGTTLYSSPNWQVIKGR